MRWMIRRGFLPLVALTLFAACDRATGPDDERYDAEPVELSLTALDQQTRDGTAATPAGPHLQRLLVAALRKIHAERGPEAARRAMTPLRELLAAARSAREAGDRALAMRKMQEANLVAARIVVFAFGAEVVPRTLRALDEDLLALQDRIAEGETAGVDVTRLRHAHRLASELRDLALRAAQARHPLRALILATRARDIAARV